MKNNKTRASLLVLIILLIPFLSACTKTEAKGDVLKNVQVAKVTELEIEANQEYGGNIEAEKETLISSKVPGQVLEIKVNIGDSLKKGDVLVRLTGEENIVARNSANSAYQDSLLNVKNTDFLMDQKIRANKEALTTAEENLKAIKTADTNEDGVSVAQIEKLQLNLQNLEIKKQNLEDTFSQRRKDIFDSALSGIRQAKTLSLNAIYNLYSINEKNLPDSGNDFSINNKFVTKNKSLALEAQTKIRKAKSDYYIFENYYEVQDEIPSQEEILEMRDKVEVLLKSINTALVSMNAVLSDVVVHTGMTSTLLASYKNDINSNINQVEAMLLSQDSGNAIGVMGVGQAIENLQTEIVNTKRAIDKQIEIAKNQLELIKSTVNSTKDELASKIIIAESQVRQAEANVATAEKAKDSELQRAKTQSDISRGQLNLANVNAASTILRAPYDGVVVERLVDEGSVIGAGTPILKFANIDSYKFNIFVPEREIIKIAIGQKAKLVLDSFPDKILEAEVVRISPKSEESSKKVRVELSLEKQDYLKIGMYARLIFEELNKRKALVVNAKAVRDVYGKKFIATVKDNRIAMKEVSIGAIVNDNYEVLSGIELGELFVIDGGINLNDGEEVKIIEK